MRTRRLVSMLLVLLFLLPFSLASAEVVKDFTFVPLDHAVSLDFTAKDYDTVVVSYTNSMEKGSVELISEDGHFTGTLELPATYPGNNVAVTIKNAKGNRVLMSKKMVQTAIQVIPWVEKAETGRLAGVTVCVDPGHTGVAFFAKEPMGPGLKGYHKTTNGQAQGVATKRLESVVVLEIGQKLRNALLLEGADVVMTRDDQETAVSNVGRAEIAAEGGADLFIRLHCDNSSNAKKRGICVYIPNSSDYAKQVADKETYYSYGEALFNAMCAATGVTKGGVLQNNSYVANNWATMPAFLVEMGYMSNAEDDVMLSTEEYQTNIVQGMVDGLVDVARLRGLIE